MDNETFWMRYFFKVRVESDEECFAEKSEDEEERERERERESEWTNEKCT